MKRTERIAIALTKEEKARIRIEASDLHISMSALFRMRVFTQPVQYVPQQQKRRLPTIPGTLLDMTRGNMINVLVELKGVLVTRRKIVDSYEEDLLREVEIK